MQLTETVISISMFWQHSLIAEKPDIRIINRVMCTVILLSCCTCDYFMLSVLCHDCVLFLLLLPIV